MSDLTYFDYSAVTKTLVAAMQSLGITLIQANSAGDQPAYPFATYAITTPDIPVGNQAQMRKHEQFEIVVSLTFKDTSALTVLNLAKKAESYLRSNAGRVFLWDNGGLVLVSVQGFSNRDNFITIDYERNVGFDVQLRATNPYAADYDDVPIESAPIKNNNQEG